MSWFGSEENQHFELKQHVRGQPVVTLKLGPRFNSQESDRCHRSLPTLTPISLPLCGFSVLPGYTGRD